jgi:2-methylfumaryl-CoA isomerase
LKDVATAMLGNLGILAEVMVNHVDRPKYGNALYGAYGQDFRIADGRKVMVVALTDRQWRGVVAVTGLADEIEVLEGRLGLDFKQEGHRFLARREITDLLTPWFAVRKVEDFGPAFDSAGVTWSVFRSFGEAVAEDPDVSTAHPMFEMVEQPGIGTYLVPGTPFESSVFERESPVRASVLGEHTEAILAGELGLADARSYRLYAEGIVAGPRAEDALAAPRPAAMSSPRLVTRMVLDGYIGMRPLLLLPPAACSPEQEAPPAPAAAETSAAPPIVASGG